MANDPLFRPQQKATWPSVTLQVGVPPATMLVATIAGDQGWGQSLGCGPVADRSLIVPPQL